MNGREFVVHAAAYGLFVGRSSVLAFDKAARNEVRAYARRSFATSERDGRTLRSLVDPLRWSTIVPEGSLGPFDPRFKDLIFAAPPAFDGLFLAAQIGAHRNMLAVRQVFRTSGVRGREFNVTTFRKLVAFATSLHDGIAADIEAALPLQSLAEPAPQA